MWTYDRKLVRLDTVDLACLDRGAGQPVVLLHGIFTNAAQYGRMLERLPSGYRYIAVDLLGHGFTRIADDQPVGVHAQVEAVRQLVERLDLAPVHLVGSGGGGRVAQVFALAYPELTRSMLLTNCTVFDHVSVNALATLQREFSRVGARRFLMDRVRDPALAREDLCFGTTVEDPAAIPDDLVRHFLEPLAETEQSARNFQRFLTGSLDTHRVEGDIQAPTTLVWGTGSTHFPLESAVALLNRLGDPRMLHVIPNARCYLHLDHPRTLAELFDSAFRDIDRAGPAPRGPHCATPLAVHLRGRRRPSP